VSRHHCEQLALCPVGSSQLTSCSPSQMSQQSVDDKMVDEKTTTPTNLSANEAPLDSELYIDPTEEKKLLRKVSGLRRLSSTLVAAG
jgi:hypothetical protein